jgi:NADPH2:quinone reductase
MLVFKTIFYRPAVGFEGVGTIDILGPRIHNLRSGQRVAVVNVKAGN